VTSGSVDRCDAPDFSAISATDQPAFVDRPGHGEWTYRIGVSANWLNDPTYGDVYLVSRARTVTVP
jgi:hypothetical protein